jgi:hypothetical protein
VLQHHDDRWRNAVRAVRRRLDRVGPRQRNERALNDILRRLKGRWNFSLLEARPDRQEFDFNIIGAMSSPQEIAEVPDNFATEDNPLPLRYPKRVSSGYPTLYFGPRTGGVTLRQRELRAAQSSDERKNRIARMLPAPRRTRWEEAGRPIEEYRPHEHRPMPLGGRPIGIAANYQVVRGKKLKLRPGDGTPGGGRINRLIRAYGYSPANEGADGDHVVEIQLGGIDHLNNLWPLDSSENRSAGATLASMSFNTPSGTTITMRQLKTLARQGRDIWFRISGTR